MRGLIGVFAKALQLVADLAQQVFPPRNVGVGFETQRRGAIHHAEHAAAQLRLRDDHLRRVGRRAIDAADLRHCAHRSQHVDRKNPSPRKIRKVWPAPMANALSRARARAASSLPDRRRRGPCSPPERRCRSRAIPTTWRQCRVHDSLAAITLLSIGLWAGIWMAASTMAAVSGIDCQCAPALERGGSDHLGVAVEDRPDLVAFGGQEPPLMKGPRRSRRGSPSGAFVPA